MALTDDSMETGLVTDAEAGRNLRIVYANEPVELRVLQA